MYLMGTIGKEVEYYSDKILGLLIPLLSSDQATSSNEALLATTIILRMSGQFLEIGHDAQRHLNGAASLFVNAMNWLPAEVNLATACFWTHLRESILSDDEIGLPASAEEVWMNRMTYLLLRVCTVCWGQWRGDGHTESKRLKALIDEWREHLPPSFRP